MLYNSRVTIFLLAILIELLLYLNVFQACCSSVLINSSVHLKRTFYGSTDCDGIKP